TTRGMRRGRWRSRSLRTDRSWRGRRPAAGSSRSGSATTSTPARSWTATRSSPRCGIRRSPSRSGEARGATAGRRGTMLTAEQRREILAVALLAGALFVLLALLPAGVVGPRAAEWFPSGNMMWMLGGAVDGLLTPFLGGSAYLVPVLIALTGVGLAGWVERGAAIRGVV